MEAIIQDIMLHTIGLKARYLQLMLKCFFMIVNMRVE